MNETHYFVKLTDHGWTMAQATADGSMEQLRQVAFGHAHRADLLGSISCGLVIFAVGCWGAASVVHENVHHLMLVALLVANILLFLVVI